MATLKPNIHQKPNLPPKPRLQPPWEPNSTHHSPALDRAIRRIEPGIVKQRSLILNSRQDGEGERLKRSTPSVTKATFQRSEGTVREQIQKLTLSRETEEEQKQKTSQIEMEERRKERMKSGDHLENNRSEPDGSEMEDSLGGARVEEVESVTPSCPLQEKHCHCICHLHHPGMKLVWVPLETKKNPRTENRRHDQSLNREDKKITSSREDMGQTENTETTEVTAHANQPPLSGHNTDASTMPQCINCQSFRLHHSPYKSQESVYESMDVLLHRPAQVTTPTAPQTQHTDCPQTEEPVYLELQPSDENPATPPTPPPRPALPPCTKSIISEKGRHSTHNSLACMLSPRGGRPPIASPSRCEKTPPTGKLKSDKQRSNEEQTDKHSENAQKISADWELNNDYEPLYQIYQRKVSETEAQLQRESPPHPCRSVSERVTERVRDRLRERASERGTERLSEGLGLQGTGASRGQRREELGEVKLWQELPVVKESGILSTLTFTQRQRQECMFEVLTSESSYLRSLRVLKDHFLGSRELNETLVIHDKKSLFSNVLQVYEVSERFLQDLRDRVDESVVISDVCDIIHQHAENHFSIYIDYVRNQLYQEKTYSRLMQCNREFYTVMRRLEESPLCRRLPFSSFILLPFQRITRIKILIQSILKRTDEGSAEEDSASRALASVSEIIQEANTQVGQMKQMEELMSIANILEFDKLKAIPLVSKTRWLEKQGDLQEFSKGGSLFSMRFRFTPVYIFLFNDLLILTTRKSLSPERFVVLDHAHRSLVEVQPLELSGPQLEHTFCLTLLENHKGNTCEHLLKANTESDLHRWTAAFPSMSVHQEPKQEKVYEDWDCPQVQGVHQYAAKQSDELSLEPGDIINIIRKTTEGWWEGLRLSDRARGWFPQNSVIEVTNEHQRRRNLREQYRIAMATRTANRYT